MSTDKILQRIISEAEEQADQIRLQAQEKAKELESSVLKKAQERADALKASAAREGEEIQKRQMLVAGLEARKQTLQAKRAVLDEVFSAALEELCSLDGERFASLITKIVLEAAQTGRETLRVPAGDRARYEDESWSAQGSMLQRLNRALEAAGKTGGLSLDPCPASFSGGVQLCGEKSDVNASFESLVKAAREESELEVSHILFSTQEE